MDYSSTVIVEHTMRAFLAFFNEIQMIKSIKKNICMQRQISRIGVWISAMVTNRSTVKKSSLFIHAAMPDVFEQW